MENQGVNDGPMGKPMTPALAKAISSLVFRGQVISGRPAGTSWAWAWHQDAYVFTNKMV